MEKPASPVPKVARSLSTIQASSNLSAIHGHIDYDMSMFFTDQCISGNAVISFEVACKSSVHICYRDGKLNQLSLNGVILEDIAYDGQILTVDLPDAGRHKIVVSFESSYSKSYSDGPVLQTDAQGNRYLYTMHEYYGSSRMFPCFDQPSIRGVYRLQATYPQQWGDIWSNGHEIDLGIVPAKKSASCSCCSKADKSNSTAILHDGLGMQFSLRLAKFRPSEPLPTYLFYIYIGNFHQIKPISSKYDQGFLCMPHAKSKLEACVDILSRVTEAALSYFEDYLDCKYPFDRYWHVFVPSDYLHMCADELPGMVIVDEAFIDMDSDCYFTKWILILCHEMAHMWFGNLVAVKFWHEVWLKESFADLLGMKCLVHLAVLQATTGVDMGLGVDPMSSVQCLKFKRRVDGYKHLNEMIVCKKCRPLIKTDIEYADEAFTCFEDDIYGRSMFDLHQFLSVDPGCLQRVCRSIVKTFAWSYIDSARFIELLMADKELVSICKTEAILQTSFDTYFKQVSLSKISAQITEKSLIFRHLTEVDRWGTLEIQIGHNTDTRMAIEIGTNCRDTEVIVEGQDIVIDIDFWGIWQLDIDFDAYITQMSDESLGINAQLVLSQIIQSKASLKQSSFKRVIRMLRKRHWRFAGFWLNEAYAYAEMNKKSTDILDGYIEEIENDFMESKRLRVDCFMIFDWHEEYQEEKKLIKITTKLKSLLNLSSTATSRHFDYLFARDYLISMLTSRTSSYRASTVSLLRDTLQNACLPSISDRILSMIDSRPSISDMLMSNRVHDVLEHMAIDLHAPLTDTKSLKSANACLKAIE